MARGATLSDAALVAEVARVATEEQQATAHLVALLAEFDARRLYLPAGCSSLFTYCTQVLHLSEHAAYHRIEAARAARRHPPVAERLAAGDLTLTGVTLLAPHLTDDNHRALLDAARHKSKREIEQLVASLRQADVASSVRKLRSASATPAAQPIMGLTPPADSAPPPDAGVPPIPDASRRPVLPARHAVVAPLAPERYKLQLTMSRETLDKLRRAQDLLRHAVPTGDLASVLDRALTLLVADLEKRKLGAVKRARGTRGGASPGAGQESRAAVPRARRRSRHIPAAVRREVWARDAGQCAFVGTAGRCSERGLLEFHHVVPYADGGATIAANLELRCRRHNQYEAERWFGQPGLPEVVRETPPLYGSGVARSPNSVRAELPEPIIETDGVFNSGVHAGGWESARRPRLAPRGRQNRNCAVPLPPERTECVKATRRPTPTGKRHRLHFGRIAASLSSCMKSETGRPFWDLAIGAEPRLTTF